jgi:hypothetical protein
MSTRKVLTLASMMTIFFVPAAFGADSMPEALDIAHYVLGEKRDSGLGDLASSYTAAEFTRQAVQTATLGSMPEALDSPHYVLGEKRDSGLGDLSSSYTAAEFTRQTAVAGEKQDSGLGDLPADYTAAEFQKQIVAKR